jgi:hypothetical protein
VPFYTNCTDCQSKVGKYNTTGLCRSCSQRGPRHHRFSGGRNYSHGYVILTGVFDHPNAKRGQIREHVLVMSNHLGRPLLPHEEVHHKNGIRDDNRIENLELWSKSQPAGARVEDLVAWANEILDLYGDSNER